MWGRLAVAGAVAGLGVGTGGLVAVEAAATRARAVEPCRGPGPSTVDLSRPGCRHFALSWGRRRDTLGLRHAANAGGACQVTKPTPRNRPPKTVPASFNYGNARVAVALGPPTGRIVAGRLPGGGHRATINPDGSIHAKVGWWRAGTRPKLEISGRRLDASAPPLGASIPDGYGRGFQATGLTFPTIGCWRVTGRFGTASLTFTVLVGRSRLGP